MRINVIQTEKTIEPCLAFIWLEFGLRAHFLLSFPTLHPLLRPLGHSLSHPPGHLLDHLYPPSSWVRHSTTSKIITTKSATTKAPLVLKAGKEDIYMSF